MSGSLRCNEVEDLLEHDGLAPLPQSAREHLAACVHCQDLLADFSTIVAAARALPAELEPPARIWISLRAQLESEGLIRDVSPVATRARQTAERHPSQTWWDALSGLFHGRALATAAVGLLIMAAGIAQ